MHNDRLTVDDIRDVTLLAVSAVICTFLKSTIKNNDLGYRSAMIGQFILLIWATEPTLALLSTWRWRARSKPEVRATANFWVRRAMPILLVIGILTSGYDLLMLRIYPMLTDVPGLAITRETWLPPGHQLGVRTYAVRSAYQWASEHLPRTAVLQHDPNMDIEIFHALYAQRPVAAADYSNGVLFGIPEAAFERVAKPITAVFADRPSEPLAKVDQTCDEFGIAALVVKDTDPIFGDRRGWAWQRSPLYQNTFVRIIGCGSGSPGSRHS